MKTVRNDTYHRVEECVDKRVLHPSWKGVWNVIDSISLYKLVRTTVDDVIHDQVDNQLGLRIKNNMKL